MNTIVNLDIYYQQKKVISTMLQQQKMAKSSAMKKLKNRRINYISINAKKLNSNYKGKDHLINIAMMNLQMILLSGFIFHFWGY